jgi:hypothetical protein
MDEMELQARKGKQAKELLEHPLLQEAFRKVEQDCQDKWRSSALSAADVREAAYYQLKALDILRVELSKVVDNGILANADLARRGKVPAK